MKGMEQPLCFTAPIFSNNQYIDRLLIVYHMRQDAGDFTGGYTNGLICGSLLAIMLEQALMWKDANRYEDSKKMYRYLEG